MYRVMLRTISVLFLLFAYTECVYAQERLEKAVSKRGDEVLVERNVRTGSAHRVYGVKLGARDFGLSVSQENLPALARAVFEEYGQVLGIDPKNIDLTRIEKGEPLSYVSGVQVVRGVPVYGTEVGFTLSAKGEVVLLGADWYPDVTVSTTPSISAQSAVAAAQSSFIADSIQVKQEPRLIILPEGNPVTFKLAWQFELFSLRPLQDIVYFVDARIGTILRSDSNLKEFGPSGEGPSLSGISKKSSAPVNSLRKQNSVPSFIKEAGILSTLTGTISGTYWPAVHTDPPATAGYSTSNIAIYDVTGRLVTYLSTNQNGYYSIGLAAGNYIFRIPLQSGYVQIRDGNDQVPLVEKAVTVVGNTFNFTWPISDKSNVKRHAQVMHDFFAGAPFYYTGVNYQMRAYVDFIRNGYLETARADGTNIYFGDYGEIPWEETAEVIRHEYTHNAVFHIYNGWIDIYPDYSQEENMAIAMEEGFSDYSVAH